MKIRILLIITSILAFNFARAQEFKTGLLKHIEERFPYRLLRVIDPTTNLEMRFKLHDSWAPGLEYSKGLANLIHLKQISTQGIIPIGLSLNENFEIFKITVRLDSNSAVSLFPDGTISLSSGEQFIKIQHEEFINNLSKKIISGSPKVSAESIAPNFNFKMPDNGYSEIYSLESVHKNQDPNWYTLKLENDLVKRAPGKVTSMSVLFNNRYHIISQELIDSIGADQLYKFIISAKKRGNKFSFTTHPVNQEIETLTFHNMESALYPQAKKYYSRITLYPDHSYSLLYKNNSSEKVPLSYLQSFFDCESNYFLN